MPCLLSRGLLLPWLTAASLRPRRPSSHLLLPLAFLPSSSKDPCGNLGPSQVIQGTVPMATVVTTSAKFPLLCKVTGSQAPGIGTWPPAGANTQPSGPGRGSVGSHVPHRRPLEGWPGQQGRARGAGARVEHRLSLQLSLFHINDRSFFSRNKTQT